MFAAALALSFATSSVATPAIPHPLDRPLADLTLEVREASIHATVMLNFRFIDLVLGSEGDPTKAPEKSEVAAIQDRVRALFAEQNRLELDERFVAPGPAENFVVAEPLPVLRREAPDYVRALTQIRFEMEYPMPTAAKNLKLEWAFYPKHPLTDDKNSPLVPMRMRAVVVQPSGASVLEFRENEREQSLAIQAPKATQARVAARAASAKTATAKIGTAEKQDSSPKENAEEAKRASPPAESRTLMLLLGALGAIAAIFAFRAYKRSTAALGMLLLALGSCGAKPSVHDLNTPSWNVRVSVDPAQVPTNEHFTAIVQVRSKTKEKLSPKAIRIDADMPAHGHGMNTKPRVTKVEDGKWKVEGLLFHMPGDWELYVDVGEGQSLERATLPLKL